VTKKSKSIVIALFSLSLGLSAQEKTISRKSEPVPVTSRHKVMLIPFEPRLYMGEVDRSINAESKLSANEIRHRFRDGLNEQLYKAFKANNFSVLDLMEDTAKYKKDVEGIYQFITYEYVKVPDQNNYRPPKKEKEQKKIDRGQLVVETNSDSRFMNSRLTNAKLVPQLNAKYKSDVFVFVNQLDIKASGSKDPGVLTENPNRKITVHYTVYTVDGKEINSGIAEEEFPATLNNQRKIIDKHFSVIANTIVKRVNKGLLPG